MIEKIEEFLTDDLSDKYYARFIESCGLIGIALFALVVICLSVFRVLDCIYYGKF